MSWWWKLLLRRELTNRVCYFCCNTATAVIDGRKDEYQFPFGSTVKIYSCTKDLVAVASDLKQKGVDCVRVRMWAGDL